MFMKGSRQLNIGFSVKEFSSFLMLLTRRINWMHSWVTSVIFGHYWILRCGIFEVLSVFCLSLNIGAFCWSKVLPSWNTLQKGMTCGRPLIVSTFFFFFFGSKLIVSTWKGSNCAMSGLLRRFSLFLKNLGDNVSRGVHYPIRSGRVTWKVLHPQPSLLSMKI